MASELLGYDDAGIVSALQEIAFHLSIVYNVAAFRKPHLSLEAFRLTN